MSKRFSSHPLFSRIWLKRFGWALLVLLGIFAAFAGGYFIGFDQAEDELFKERKQTEKLIQQIQQIAVIDEDSRTEATTKQHAQQEEIRRLKEELRALLERERAQEKLMPQHEYAPKDKKALPPPSAKRPERLPGTEARLVIIIDDVSYARDVRAIESTGLPLVMSFLPPSSRHPDSAALARSQKLYMVHLPLEALDYDAEEPSTLRIGDSEETIEHRIADLKKLYPSVRYINNHTGSKFTADEGAMERLIRVLKKDGIQFVDSRTTAKTEVPAVSRRYGVRYMGRDVFLDHKDGVENVKKQIREAVEKANRYGSAIAIGHPRPDTIRALSESKELLRQVRLVGIDQI